MTGLQDISISRSNISMCLVVGLKDIESLYMIVFLFLEFCDSHFIILNVCTEIKEWMEILIFVK